MSQDDLSARVRRLELIELAKTATINYARACDRKAVDELRTNVFTSDAALHVPNREFRGIDDVAGFYDNAFAAEPGSRRHFLTNQLTEVVGEDRVRVESYFVFLSADAGWVIGWGQYRDVVVVGDDGPRITDKPTPSWGQLLVKKTSPAKWSRPSMSTVLGTDRHRW